jgi:hypothetical protein
MHQLNGTVLEAASWRLATSIVRRHPEFFIRREHPNDGQYNCLAVRSERGLLIYLNRMGTIQVHAMESPTGNPNWQPTEWLDYVTAEDPRDFTRKLEAAARIPDVASTPSSTSAVLVYRTLAALANMHALADPISIEMSIIDGPYGGQAPWLENYPGIAQAVRSGVTEAWGYWHASSRDVDVALETARGVATNRRGHELDLMNAYRSSGRNFARLTAQVLELASASS